MIKEKYWAFISYSNKDKASAEKIHKALEQFSFPKELVRSGKVPKRMRPIFKDRDELACGEDLNLSIKSAIANSYALIVLCSPEAAKSRWVNLEIREFKKAKPDHKIICIVVGGGSHSNQGPRYSFPSALEMDTTLLWVDIRPNKKAFDQAIVSTLAGIINLGYDDLFQRHQRAKFRAITNKLILATTILLTLIVSIGITIITDKERKLALSQSETAKKSLRLAESRENEALVLKELAELRANSAEQGREMARLKAKNAELERAATENDALSLQKKANYSLLNADVMINSLLEDIALGSISRENIENALMNVELFYENYPKNEMTSWQQETRACFLLFKSLYMLTEKQNPKAASYYLEQAEYLYKETTLTGNPLIANKNGIKTGLNLIRKALEQNPIGFSVHYKNLPLNISAGNQIRKLVIQKRYDQNDTF